MPRVSYLGLSMDATTLPQIIAAVRGLYPDLVLPTDSDDLAVQKVLRHIITEHLASWAARSATPPLDEVIATATNDALAQQDSARDAALVVATDVQVTATS